MRILNLMLVSFLLSGISYGAEKSLDDLYLDSKKLYDKALKEPIKAQLYFNSLRKLIEETKIKYEKLNPTLGKEEETKISVFYYALDPVNDIVKEKNNVEEKCIYKKHEILSDDATGKGDNNSNLDKESSEALKWLKLFCKNI